MSGSGNLPPEEAAPDEGVPGDAGMGDAGASEAGTDDSRPRAKKAPNAFRTISEVADELHIPQHVLRFWETKFPQIKPHPFNKASNCTREPQVSH